jgi:zinc protease
MTFFTVSRSGIAAAAVSCAALWVASTAAAFDLPDTRAGLGWDKRVTRGTLDNGFQFVFLDSRTVQGGSKDRIQATLLVDAGARDETDDQHGVAHMVEHMVFREARGLKSTVRDELFALGLKQGREFNAMTSDQLTRYMINMPMPETASLKRVFNALEKLAFHAEIIPNKWEAERNIVREEWRGKLSHRQRINDKKKALLRTGFARPPRPVIGTLASINDTQTDKIQQFYSDWYAPNNMALVVMAPMKADAFKAMITPIFSSVAPKALPTRQARDPKLTDGLQVALLTDPENQLDRVAMMFRFPEENDGSEQAARQHLIRYMARSLLSDQISRQKVRLPKGVRQLSMTKSEVGDSTAILGVAVNVDAGKEHAGLTAILTELEAIQRYGISEADFEQEKARVKTVAQQNQQAAKERGDLWMVKMVDAVSRNTVLFDPIGSNQKAIERLDGIKRDDINQEIRRWLTAKDQIIYVQRSAAQKGHPLPNPDSVAETRAYLKQQVLPKLVKHKASVQARELAPSSHIASSTLLSREETTGISEWTLENGDRLVLLVQTPEPTDTANKTRVRAVSAAGYEQLSENPTDALVANIMVQSGLRGWTAAELKDWEKRHKAYLSVEHSQDRLVVDGTAPNDELGALLAMYRAHVLKAQVKPDVLEQWQRNMERYIATRDQRPSEVFNKTLLEKRFGPQPYDGLQRADLETLTPNQLETRWQRMTQFPTTFYIQTSLPESVVMSQVNQYLGDIPRDGALQSTVEKRAFHLSKGVERIELSNNTIPRANYRLLARAPLKWTPKTAVQVGFLSDQLAAYLKRVLRTQAQGVYQVSVDLTLQPVARFYPALDNPQEAELSTFAALSVRFSAAPERVDALAKEVEQALGNWYQVITPESVERAKAAFRIAEKGRLNPQSETWLHRLQLSLEQYGDSRYLQEMHQLEQAFEPVALMQLAKQLSWEDQVIGIQRPKDGQMDTRDSGSVKGGAHE